MTAARPGTLRRLWWGLTLRCPDCGSGGIRRGWSDFEESCPRCGHRLDRHEGFWLGAIAINTGATIVVFAAVLVGSTVAFWPNPPWGVIAVVTVAVNAIFPILFYPVSKTLWLAVERAMGGEA